MRANTAYLATDVQTVQVGWGDVREWAKKVFASDAMEDVVLAAANVAMVGTVMFSLHKAMQMFGSAGFGMTAFGPF